MAESPKPAAPCPTCGLLDKRLRELDKMKAAAMTMAAGEKAAAAKAKAQVMTLQDSLAKASEQIERLRESYATLRTSYDNLYAESRESVNNWAEANSKIIPELKAEVEKLKKQVAELNWSADQERWD